MNNDMHQSQYAAQTQYNASLFRFIKKSPTQFHAVSNMAEKLDQNGFNQLKEENSWNLEKKNRYYVMRNNSSIIAFVMGENEPWETGIKIVGAHTDSPCLRIKPVPELKCNSMTSLSVEIYGGVLLNTWFDRGLNLAGRVTCLVQKKNVKENEFLTSLLINFNGQVAVIPSLAIHLDREANKNKSVNPQFDVSPLFYLDGFSNKTSFKEILLGQAQKEYPDILIKKVFDFEMSFSNGEPPCYTGLNQEFILGPRLDNLLSCHAGLKSLIAADTKNSSMLVCTDHEEVGSESIAGARGSFLTSILARISQTPERIGRTAAKSMMISWDNAHAVHPAHGERHDVNHLPKINKGPVLKINASLRYASNSESSAIFKFLCKKANTPLQTFVMRSDMPCGSTTGPLISSKTGIKTVDAGAPTLAMHSISELTGIYDPYMVFKVTSQLFSMTAQPLLSLT